MSPREGQDPNQDPPGHTPSLRPPPPSNSLFLERTGKRSSPQATSEILEQPLSSK